MKAHRNMRLSLSTVPQTLFALGCIALLFSMPVQAQNATGTNEDGRSQQDLLRRGAPTPVADPAPTDVWKGCDFDDCSKSAVARQEPSQPGASELSNPVSFRIQPGAPSNSFFIAEEGNVGLGTETPGGRLHVVARPDDGGGDLLLLDKNGNLEIGGLLTEASSVLLKENFTPVEAANVLARLAGLPISTWNYKTDDPAVRHMGPTAQDFYAAFGLGQDAEHIAPLDANGVAMVAAQALYAQGQAQAARIATLEQQNAELLQRLEALEALVREKP